MGHPINANYATEAGIISDTDGRLDFLGIDFSGSADQWRRNVKTPSVWIARLSNDDKPAIRSLEPVQSLPGTSQPFENLAALLAAGEFSAAGIDAPFAIPSHYTPAGGWDALIRTVDSLPHAGRPFPEAQKFLSGIELAETKKPMRLTEQFWHRRKVNVRSTLWWKPRGGAPFAAACMKLIALSRRPCWPWVLDADRGLLVEAFPAAQLRGWGLPHQRYNGHEMGKVENRAVIIDRLRDKIILENHEETMRSSADALDAVLAAFAAIAARRCKYRKPDLVHADLDRIKVEGWICVHR